MWILLKVETRRRLKVEKSIQQCSAGKLFLNRIPSEFLNNSDAICLGPKILQNLHCRFDWHCIGQISQNFQAFSENMNFKQFLGHNSGFETLGTEEIRGQDF
jgi:hypothetical protein